jgi:hypothetical protein
MESLGGSMEEERCEICNKLTGKAGRGDDSIVCEVCERVICKNCLELTYEEQTGYTLCVECKDMEGDYEI